MLVWFAAVWAVLVLWLLYEIVHSLHQILRVAIASQVARRPDADDDSDVSRAHIETMDVLAEIRNDLRELVDRNT